MPKVMGSATKFKKLSLSSLTDKKATMPTTPSSSVASTVQSRAATAEGEDDDEAGADERGDDGFGRVLDDRPQHVGEDDRAARTVE